MTESLDSARDRFVRDRATLFDDCRFGSMYLRQWVRLTEELNDHPSLSQVGFHFFGSISLGLQELAYVQLGRLFDSHPDSVNVSKFLNFVEQNARIFSNSEPSAVQRLVHEQRQLLDTLQPEIAKVRTLRNARFAHRDRRATSEDLAASSLQLGQMRKLFETVAHILNELSVRFDNSQFSLEFVAEDDVNRVLTLLERGMELPGIP